MDWPCLPGRDSCRLCFISHLIPTNLHKRRTSGSTMCTSRKLPGRNHRLLNRQPQSLHPPQLTPPAPSDLGGGAASLGRVQRGNPRPASCLLGIDHGLRGLGRGSQRKGHRPVPARRPSAVAHVAWGGKDAVGQVVDGEVRILGHRDEGHAGQ